MINIGLFSKLFSKDYEDVKYEEILDMIKEKHNYQFIDVRSKQEYKQGHGNIFNKNIDYSLAVRNPSLFNQIKKDKAVVVICASGARSNATCRMLKKMGYNKVYNVKRGYRAWNGTLVR